MMNKLMEIAQNLAKILIESVEEIDLIHLFGSIALGNEHSNSDIEIVAVSNSRFCRWEFMKLVFQIKITS